MLSEADLKPLKMDGGTEVLHFDSFGLGTVDMIEVRLAKCYPTFKSSKNAAYKYTAQ